MAARMQRDIFQCNCSNDIESKWRANGGVYLVFRVIVPRQALWRLTRILFAPLSQLTPLSLASPDGAQISHDVAISSFESQIEIST